MKLVEMLEHLFHQYGYFVLLFGLPLDFIALPIPPGNSTLTYTGYLTYRGELAWAPAFAAALAGAILGVTITWFLGYKLGMPLVERYGKWLSLKPAHVDKVHRYFDKYGTRLLLIGFFIPGVRQFIGYFIGIIRIPFRTVILYAYAGTALWVAGFFSIGYFFGKQWEDVFALVQRYLGIVFAILGGLLLVYILWKWFNRSGKKAE